MIIAGGMVRKLIVIVSLFLLAGCISKNNPFFPEQPFYYPPLMTDDTAKIRLIGATMTYAIYQTDTSGQKFGGWVQKHDRFINKAYGPTQDMGFPKLKNKKYSDAFFETTLLPDLPTTIHHEAYKGCSVDIHFTPKKGALYEVHYDYGTDTCVINVARLKYNPASAEYEEIKP
ncbi:hypothetical protein H650_09910 [Enterobacter sp. R4-368]|nr:hypothetical protein H650_09910 [Enterobacter sp. R4-368]